MDESIVSDVGLSQTQTEIPEAPREPTHAKNLLFMVLYTVANMVIGVSNVTLGTILLPEHIAAFAAASQTGIFALILGVGAVAAVLTNPLAGMFSDRTTLRLGRRRPWLIAGGALTVLDLLLLARAPSLLVVAIEWIVLQIGVNMLQVALVAILPDQVPLPHRATISPLAAGSGTLPRR